MTPDEYQKQAARTECDQRTAAARLSGLANQTNLPTHVQCVTLPARLNHAVNGLAAEAGELLGLFEKWIYFGQMLNREKMADELGDALWYIAEACNALGLSLSAVMEANIRKLRTRFPDRFTEHDVKEENRDRGSEAEEVKRILENHQPGLTLEKVKENIKSHLQPVITDEDRKDL